MTTEQFAYWLQGFSEIHGEPPSAEQWAMIKEHLQTCFVKVTGTTKLPGIEDYIKQHQQQIIPLRTGDNQWVPPTVITC